MEGVSSDRTGCCHDSAANYVIRPDIVVFPDPSRDKPDVVSPGSSPASLIVCKVGGWLEGVLLRRRRLFPRSTSSDFEKKGRLLVVS